MYDNNNVRCPPIDPKYRGYDVMKLWNDCEPRSGRGLPRMFDIQVNSILIYIHLMQKLAECGKWFRVTKKNLLERFNHSGLLVSWVKPTASTSKMSSSDFQFAEVEDYYNCSLKCWARKMCFLKNVYLLFPLHFGERRNQETMGSIQYQMRKS